MRRSSSRCVLAIAASFPVLSGFAQHCQYEDSPLPMGMSTVYESKFGKELPASGLLRILVILAEVDYADPLNDPCGIGGYTGWPQHQLPTWVDNPVPALNLFEWQQPIGAAEALFTRYYQEASSGNFIVIADFSVRSTTGALVLTGYERENGQADLDVSGLTASLYYITVRSTSNSIYHATFIKRT